MDAELARLIAAGRYNTALPIAAHNQGFATQGRVFQQFYRYKKGIEIKMGYMLYTVGQGVKSTTFATLNYAIKRTFKI